MNEISIAPLVPAAASGNLTNLITERAWFEPNRTMMSRPLGDGWQKVSAQELDAEIKRLGGEGFKNVNQVVQALGNNLQDATKQVKLMEGEVDELKNTFGNIASTLKNIVADINGSVKTSTLLTRNFNKLEDLANKIQRHREEENVLTVKELKELEKKVKKEKEALDVNYKQAKAETDILAAKIKSGKAVEITYSAFTIVSMLIRNVLYIIEEYSFCLETGIIMPEWHTFY